MEDPGLDERIILIQILRKWEGRDCTGLICIRIGTGGRHL
jgi:hypothetical protein